MICKAVKVAWMLVEAQAVEWEHHHLQWETHLIWVEIWAHKVMMVVE
jgi:hypothetical protein